MSHHPSRAVLSGGAGERQWEGLREGGNRGPALRSPGCCPWWGRGGLGAARTVGGRGVRDPPSGSLSRRVWNRAQCKGRMLRPALRFGTKDVTRTLVVCTPGGKEARRVPGTEPGRREVAPRSQAARQPEAGSPPGGDGPRTAASAGSLAYFSLPITLCWIKHHFGFCFFLTLDPQQRCTGNTR